MCGGCILLGEGVEDGARIVEGGEPSSLPRSGYAVTPMPEARVVGSSALRAPPS
jgi:hypothetical protein